MSVKFDPSVSSASVRDQAQVAVMKQAMNLEQQNATQLINAVSQTMEAQRGGSNPQRSANPPGVGQNINITV